MKVTEKMTDDARTEFRQVFAGLLRERMAGKGLTESEIVQLTKINPKFIHVLTLGDFDELPGQVFGRGFVKNICKILGPGNEDLLVAYDRGFGLELSREFQAPVISASGARTISDATAGGDQGQVGVFRNPKMLLGLGITATVLVSLTIVFLAGPQQNPQVPVDSAGDMATVEDLSIEKKGDVTPPASTGPQIGADVPTSSQTPQAVAGVAELPASGVVASPVAEVQKEVPVGGAVGQGDSAAHGSGAVENLEMVVSQPVKVRKKFGDEAPITEELAPNTYNFRVDERAEFLIYDASAVRIKFSGRDLGELGAKGRIRKLVFVSEKSDKKIQ